MSLQSASRLTATAPKSGELFAGKYLVERTLGIGGMGYVIAATHVHLRERVAIKILLPDLVGEEELVRRFLREGRAAVGIRSPHVARVKDVGELPDRTPYLVMEYLEGSDLGALLEARGRVPSSLAVDWVLQACEAIAEAHAMQTVHRDLKPSNLFLAEMPDGTPIIKVLDFGISKMASVEPGALAMTGTMEVFGSPTYMSPEQLKASRTVDHRADIWSLGVILHELIAGAVPFDAQSIAELSVQILSDDPPWLASMAPEVPDELAAIVATCLRKKADERFIDLADLANAIAPFGSDEAMRSAERITKTLGMPQARASVARVARADASPSERHAATLLDPVLPPAPLGAPPSSVATPRKGVLLAFVVGAVALAVVGVSAGAIGISRRTAALARASAAHAPVVAPTLAPSADSIAASSPTAASRASAGAGAVAAPVTGVSSAARPSPAAAPAISGKLSVARPPAAAPPVRSAEAAPTAASRPPPAIATSSKD